jgi:cytoskeletal protein CcmA (bactofilin family)
LVVLRGAVVGAIETHLAEEHFKAEPSVMSSEKSDSTVIGVGAVLKGELSLAGPAQILGTVEGQIHSQSQVQVGQTAQCNAAVQAPIIIVDGAVTGDLIATERLQLTAKAVVRGDIAAAALAVAEGASFSGHVSVGPEAVARAQKKAAPNIEAKPAMHSASHKSEDWATSAHAA